MREPKPSRLLFGEIDIILSQLFRDCVLVLAQLRSDVFEAG